MRMRVAAADRSIHRQFCDPDGGAVSVSCLCLADAWSALRSLPGCFTQD